MYYKLKGLDLVNPQSTEWNWVSQLRLVLRKIGHEYLLDHDSIESIRLALTVINGRLKRLILDEDTNRAIQSSFSLYYRFIKDLHGTSREPYLKCITYMFCQNSCCTLAIR